MPQRLTMITLAVQDIAKTRDFFEIGLGWTLNASPSPDIAFYQIPGMVFALYSRDALSREIALPVTDQPFGALTLAWNGRTQDEVDAMYAKAVAAGATPVKPPEEAFWGGYSSYVEIPGGHLLEIAHNPFWTLNEDGTVQLPPATGT